MVTFLKVRSGPETGRQFPLDRARPIHIGRGNNCQIVLSDPIASRFHAVVYFEDDRWQVRDTQSRNGMLVNGQKTDHAMLMDQSVLQVGGTELQLIDPVSDSVEELPLSQTVQLDRPMADLVPEGFPAVQFGAELEQTNTGHLLDLYQLSLRLLLCNDPGEITSLAIELLADRTQADVVGFLWDSGDGKLTPERIFPPDSKRHVRLSKKLTQRVLRGGEAIWIHERPEAMEGTTSGENWSDAICVPMMSESLSMGVLHLYREQRHFCEEDFELAIASGRLIAAALANARKTHSLQADHQRLADRNAHSDELIGESRPMVKLKEKIRRIGRAHGSVLVRGESGSGKELVARALHRASPRAERPMLSVNCAAIPRDLMESQLFGHRKGAFTGADTDHIGWFQQAHTGTLFLDEIGELTLDGQAKLLRILEGHPFLPVGAVKEVLADVRVIAATNRDLAEFVRAKQFREDLYYRLSVFELIVPPLRDRGDDIGSLIDHFLDHFCRQHGRPTLQLSEDARAHLLRYAWPGNVRQLRNVIDSAVVLAEDPAIELEDLGLRDTGVSTMDTLRLDLWEKRLIRKALKRTDGNVPEAAKLLGISRATAYRKISDYEIDR